MKFRYLALFGIILTTSGCAGVAGAFGGQSRSALAQQTVNTYWSDVGHAKMSKAYGLLTSGNRAQRPLSQYSQDMFAFLTHVQGLKAKAGKPTVHGDLAVVPVALTSPLSSGSFHAYQHLFWENGGWKISDQDGGLSHHR